MKKNPPQKYILLIILGIIILLFLTEFVFLQCTESLSQKAKADTLQKMSYDDQYYSFLNQCDKQSIQARSYIITGRISYLEQYISTNEERLKNANTIDQIYRSFKDDNNISLINDTLTSYHTLLSMELHALKLTAEAYQLPKEQMPSSLLQYPLNTTEEALSAQAKLERAASILYSSDYDSCKTNVLAPLKKSGQLTAWQMETKLLQTEKQLKVLKRCQFFFLLIILSVIMIAIYYIFRSSLAPLAEYTNSMKGFTAEDISHFRLNPHGSRETFLLASEINSILNLLLTAITESRDKSTYLSVVSHEIRTSMNTIVGIGELLGMENSLEKMKEYSIDIQNASHYLLSIINDILDITRLTTGNTAIVEREYSTYELISELVHMFFMPSDQKNLDLTVDISKDIPSIVEGDDIRIRQICMNLISNAIKFTKEGSISIHILCNMDESSVAHFTFQISDTGIGISEEEQKKIFQAFTRLPYAANSQTEGTGLGLAISKRYALLMNGDIKVQSVPKKGSTFTFTVSQRVIDATPMKTVEMNRSYFSHKITFVAPDARILIVDDHPTNLKVAKGLLEAYQIKPDLANSGADALQSVEITDYDIIFMDHMMPDMDGCETAAAIKEKHPDVIIIALSATVSNESRITFKESGMIDFLKKPMEIQSLESILKAYLPNEKIVYYESLDPDCENSAIDPISIPGIDYKLGLKYTSNNVKAYNSLLSVFYSSGNLSLEKIRKYQLSNYYKGLSIEIHGLKSTSLSVGASSLNKHSLELEKSLADNDYTFFCLHIDSYIKEFETLLKNIKKYLDGTITDSDKTPVTMDDFRQNLTLLLDNIEKYNFQNTNQILTQLSHDTIPEFPELTKEALNIQAMIKDCRYHDAIHTCQNLLKKTERL